MNELKNQRGDNRKERTGGERGEQRRGEGRRKEIGIKKGRGSGRKNPACTQKLYFHIFEEKGKNSIIFN